MEISINQSAPDSYRKLVWEIFFASRLRGAGNLAMHFPWIDVAVRGTSYLTATLKGTLAGGLVVRALRGEDQGAPRAAAIGLVCVDPEFRGRGLSRSLLARAVTIASAEGLDALVLWTGKPQVYERLGFLSSDPALFGWVEAAVRPMPPTAMLPVSHSWPTQRSARRAARGLPAFASRGTRWCSSDGLARLIALEDAEGPIVAEWRGPADATSELMERALPARFRLNAIVGDPLIETMTRRGWRVDLTRSRLQMILPLRTGAETFTATGPAVRVLDRI